MIYNHVHRKLQGQVIAKRTLLERPGVPDNIKKVYFNLQGFNQYGLLHDDVLHETEIIQEAISRLPPEMQVNLGSGRFFIQHVLV